MAWLAIDKSGTECIFNNKPSRSQFGTWRISPHIILPDGSIKKLIGRDLTWDDDPVQI